MTNMYDLHSTDDLLSPSLLIFKEPLRHNVQQMIAIAGGASRLRPHCKTHKMHEIAALLLAAGINKHKCATLAEAEMLAQAGVKDIVWAYQAVGPNIDRVVEFYRSYPDVTLATTVDDPQAVRQLSDAMASAGQSAPVLLDLDTGFQRTGLPAGDAAVSLYRLLHDLPGVSCGGIHLYDGQNHQSDVNERRAAVMEVWNQGSEFRDQLQSQDLPVPRIVAGGTGSFPIFADLADEALELSPGTCVLYDAGYGTQFADLPFQPAAAILTRVISRPTANRVTFDLGYKAVASDPAPEKRVVFPTLPDARIVLQNEEHLVLETAAAADLSVGDCQMAIPWHICPTCALHAFAYVIEEGRCVGRWEVAARDRIIRI